MTRPAFFAALLIGLLSAASKADVEKIPPPREVRPDGSRAPAPEPDPDTLAARAAKPGTAVVAKAENPAETVEKIIKNSKDISDRLANTDTGTDTRKTQDETLALIDSLLNPPPPPPSGGGGMSDKNDKDKDKDKEKDKDNKDPSGGMKDNKDPSGGMNDKNDMPPPMGDMPPPNGGRKPRMGDNDKQPMPPGKQPDLPPPMGGMDPKKQPMPPPMGMPMPMPPMTPAGGTAGDPKGPASPKATLPLDDEVTKEVWGHLPDKLRQQVSQYYKEQFMPKYADLLKQYYSSLASQNPKPPELKR